MFDIENFEKRKKRKTMPLFAIAGFVSRLFILFGVVWLGSKGMATDYFWSHNDYLDFWDQNVQVLDFSLLFLTNFHIPQWQACTSKLTRNCLAIDWEPVNSLHYR